MTSVIKSSAAINAKCVMSTTSANVLHRREGLRIINTTLERTILQAKVILAGIIYLKNIEDENFSMGISLATSIGFSPIKKTNLRVGLASNIMLSQVLSDEVTNNTNFNDIQEAALLIGLKDNQKIKLFQPEHPWADLHIVNPKKNGYISRHHAIWALFYFFYTGLIRWEKEKLLRWVLDHDQHNITGARA